MSNFLQEKKAIMLFLMLILFLLVGLGYIYKIKPVQDELAITRMNVQNIETEIQILNAQLTQGEEDVEQQKNEADEQAKIEVKLPVARYLDDILIQLASVESATNSKINSISFATTEGTLSEADIQTMRTGFNLTQADEEVAEGEETAGETAENGATETPTENPPPPIPGVENIRLVTVNLSVTSPDYNHFRQFLTAIEELERITRIDSFSFSNTQQKNAEGKPLPLTVGIQITTFYYLDGQTQ